MLNNSRCYYIFQFFFQVEAWGLLCGVGTGGILWIFLDGNWPLLWIGSVAALLHGAAVIVVVIGKWNLRDKMMYETMEGLIGAEDDSVGANLLSPCEDRHYHDPSNSSGIITRPPSTPGRYRRGCGGDRIEASRRWKLTLQWRKSEHVDGILNEKQVHFESIKKYYPHFIYGHAKSGSPVYYDFPGKGKLSGLSIIILP